MNLERVRVNVWVPITALALFILFIIFVPKLANMNESFEPAPTRVEVDGGPVTPDQYDGVVRLAPTEYCFNRIEWVSLNEGEVFCED